MENNSNSLLGWESVANMFTQRGGMISDNLNDDEEYSDEEIEKLKQQSSKFNKVLNKKAKEAGNIENNDEENNDNDDDDEENNEEIDEYSTEDDKTSSIKSKNTSDKNDKKTDKSNKNSKDKTNEDESENESVEEDENKKVDNEEDNVEIKQVSALFNAIADEIGWTFEDDEKKPETVEELVEYIKDSVVESSVPTYSSEEVKKIDEFVRNGGNLEKYFSVVPELDLDNLDLTKESNQKQIIKMFLLEKGFNDNQITKKIERYEDSETIEDEAADALEAMKEIKIEKKEQLLEDQKKANARLLEDQQKFVSSVVEEIKAMNNIHGIKIPEKDKKSLLSYIFNADAEGKTAYQKDFSKSVKNLIESAYFTMKGDFLFDNAKKMGTSSAINNLKQSLMSTSINKGTKKINTSKGSNDIFSMAVQQLH